MKNSIILVLSILVIGLGSYFIFDKFNSSNNVSKNNTENNNNISNTNTQSVNNKISQNYTKNSRRDSLDADFKYYFQNYIPRLINELYDSETGFNLKDYNNDDNIKSFLNTYYSYNACKLDLCTYEDSTIYYYVPKSELDKITYALFAKEGLDDYTYHIRETYSINKIDEENYRITWFATSSMVGYSLERFPKYNLNNNIVDVTSEVFEINPLGEKTIGNLKFTFNYNSEKQMYYLANIEEKKY